MGEVEIESRDLEATNIGLNEGEDNKRLATWRLSAILCSLCVGLMLSMMDNSIVSTSIYTIALEFNSLADAIWAILAYTLSYLGFAVIFAQLSDFTGRKYAVLSAFTVFIAFSIGCGFAQSLHQLIAFRTFQGIGGSGLYALTLIIALELSTPKTWPVISGLVGSTIAIAGVLGPILGGVLTEYATWRWIFWINAPCGAVPMVMFALAWPRYRAHDQVIRKDITKFDAVGSLLLLAASVLVVFGLQEGGTGAFEWGSSVVIVTLVVGCVCWIALLAWSFVLTLPGRSNIAAIYPLRLFSHRVLAAGIISTMFTGFTFFVVIFNLPLRMQIVNGQSPAAAGLRLLPLLCATAVGSFLGGAASSKKNRTFHTFALATALVLLCTGLLSTIPATFHLPGKMYGYEVIVGLGIGLTFSTISLLTSLETRPEDHAVGQGIVSQVRVFGGSIGVAAANAVTRVECHRDLQGILSGLQIDALQSSPKIIDSLNASQAAAVRQAYSDAFSQSLRICVYMSAAAFVAALFTWQRHPTLKKH
ncbi:major facilitator superfamily domain-containing protein [Aspergillus desertorum]